MPLRLKQKASTFNYPNLFISRHKRKKILPEIHFERMIHFYFTSTKEYFVITRIYQHHPSTNPDTEFSPNSVASNEIEIGRGLRGMHLRS